MGLSEVRGVYVADLGLPPSFVKTPAGRIDLEASRAALWAQVARLPARQRLALTLRIVDELDYEEIARRVGGSAATARATVYQATQPLRLGVDR